MTMTKREQYTATQREKRARDRARRQKEIKLDALDILALRDLDKLRAGWYTPQRFSPLALIAEKQLEWSEYE